MEARSDPIPLEYRGAGVARREPPRRSLEPIWLAAMIGAAGMFVVSYGLLAVTFLASVVYERFLR